MRRSDIPFLAAPVLGSGIEVDRLERSCVRKLLQHEKVGDAALAATPAKELVSRGKAPQVDNESMTEQKLSEALGDLLMKRSQYGSKSV